MYISENTTTAAVFQSAIPSQAFTALSVFDTAGEEGWLVGGCVRDVLLNRPIHDVDIACSTLWTESKTLFSNYRTHETGTQHGTITAVVDELPLEITTFRTDGAYKDGRHPEQVQFVRTIEEDLARRDFTINAMAYHPVRGMVDPYGGSSDCAAGVIRCVGDPFQRFSEDALRILRAVRFQAQLGFEIENSTLEAILEHRELLRGISIERIREELTKTLCGPFACEAIMQCIDVIGVIIPELLQQKGFDQRTPYHCYDVLEHSARTVENTPNTPLLRWAALLHDIGKPVSFFEDETGRGHFYGHAKAGVPLAQNILKRLNFGKPFIEDVCLLVRHHDDVVPLAAKSVRKALRRMNGDAQMFRNFCAIQIADSEAHASEFRNRTEHARQLEALLEEILACDEAFCIKDLAVNGSDLMDLGVEQGPLIGKTLNRLLDEVIEENVRNERKALLNLTTSWIK